MVKNMNFYRLQKIQKQLLDKGLDPSKIEVHTSGEYFGKKIADAITKSNNDNIEKQEPVEEIIIPPEKKERNINPLVPKL